MSIHPRTIPAMQTPDAKPFVKWVGGKQALAERLVKSFPRNFHTYYEPFVGGGSVLFTLKRRRAVICDQNEWLLDTYLAIRQDWRHVERLLAPLKNTEDEYLRIRQLRPSELDLFERAAHFIYLNKTCFRGLFRVNRKGQFNVPYGQYQRRYFEPGNLEAVSVVLQSVEIRRGDFEVTLEGITSRDFVYFDPPYYKLGGYSDFNRYTSSPFREEDHSRLARRCQLLSQQGTRWALSNSDTPFVRSLFGEFHVERISTRREINLDASQRDIAELLITPYETARRSRGTAQASFPFLDAG